MSTRFWLCPHCGDLVARIRDGGGTLHCCQTAMQPVRSETDPARAEKHRPVCTVKDGVATVSVGQTAHPMTSEHYIEWVCLETQDGMQYRQLHPGMPPQVSFPLAENDRVQATYAFCNLHGLYES